MLYVAEIDIVYVSWNPNMIIGNRPRLKELLIVPALICIAALLLGLFTTSQYVRARGISYLEQGNQIKRHRAVLEGHAGNPWQYRVLAAHLNKLVLEVFEHLGIPHHIAVSFIFVRVIQDTVILVLSLTSR